LKAEDIDNSSEPISLFEIDSHINLELQDCQLKTDDPSNSPAISHAHSNRKTIAISCLQTENLKEKINNSGIIINSCCFFGFSFPIVGETAVQLFITKSTFIKSQGRCITLLNPWKTIVEGCSFEAISDTAIDIRIDKISESLAQKKSIKLIKNIISDCHSTGIILSCVQPSAALVIPQQCFEYDAIISENQIQSPKSDGIKISNLNISHILFTNNSVLESGNNGISITNSQSNSFVLNHNSFQQSTGSGVYIIESSCRLTNCDCGFNKQSGIYILGNPLLTLGHETPKYRTVEICECLVRNNKNHGIAVQDFSNGEIRVIKCQIESNHENGVWAFCSDPFVGIANQSVSMSCSQIGPAPNIESKILIEGGHLKFNRASGLFISQQIVILDNVSIRSNCVFAIHLLSINDEKFVRPKNAKTMKSIIEGKIGGIWGKSKIFSSGICTCCKDLCNVL